jgi:hypothetical protein
MYRLVLVQSVFGPVVCPIQTPTMLYLTYEAQKKVWKKSNYDVSALYNIQYMGQDNPTQKQRLIQNAIPCKREIETMTKTSRHRMTSKIISIRLCGH